MFMTFSQGSRRSVRSFGAVFAATLTVLGLAAAAQAQVEFQGLGDLPGGWFESEAYGVNADGSVVVGGSDSANGYQAFRWIKNAPVMVGLGDLPGGGFFSVARGVNADGSVVVGEGTSAKGSQAFRWFTGYPSLPLTGTMEGLGYLAPPAWYSPHYSLATGVSANGNTVVGYGDYGGGYAAFIRIGPSGLPGININIGDFSGGDFLASQATAVSGDGSVVVGAGAPGYVTEAFRWTNAGGMVGLSDLPGGNHYSAALGVNADGSVIVGVGTTDDGPEAFRWTSGGGMKSLDNSPGVGSEALAVSGNGAVVIGFKAWSSGHEAFVWNSSHGMVMLKDYLLANFAGSLPANFSLWRLREATAISADGTTIVGWGVNPAGKLEAWRVRKANGF